ncbi:NYNRI protein, partial [Amia calva]|nr:NYNRI protein [Amia calva]
KFQLITKLPLPVTKTALHSFLGLMGYQRDFIPEFATFAKPLYELLRKEVPEDFYSTETWTENHTKAIEQLKQALVQATVLLTPNPTLPFHLEVGSSKEALTAVLYQERHGVLKPVAFASRCLQGVERQYDTCTRHLLATFWAVKHFTYITGLNKVVLHTPHTPLNLLLKPTDTLVSSQRLSHWTLLMLQRDLDLDCKRTTLIPQMLLMQGKPHECPLPDTDILPNPFVFETRSQVPNVYIDGSAYISKNSGRLLAGFAVLFPEYTVKFSCPGQSSQYSELAALLETLRITDDSADIYTDSAYVVTACTLLPLYAKNNFRSSDDRPLKHATLLQHMWSSIQSRPGEIAVLKVKAHVRKDRRGEHHIRNYEADRCAKFAARHCDMWHLPDPLPTNENVSALANSQSLFEIQKLDSDIQTNIHWHLQEKPLPQPMFWSHKTTLVAPDIFDLFHNSPVGGHFSVEKTLEKITQYYWWPTMKADMTTACHHCLVCLQVNPAPFTHKSKLINSGRRSLDSYSN